MAYYQTAESTILQAEHFTPSDATRLSNAEGERLMREQTAEELRTMLQQAGHKVYTVLRHVSRSGMQRRIDLYVMLNNELHWISRMAARVCPSVLHFDEKTDSIKLNGCGMDMGFHAVYSLSSSLYGHNDRGGYKLTHQWI